MSFRIVQAVREFSTAGGAEVVAYELQRAWQEAGVPSTVLTSTSDGEERQDVQIVAGWNGRVPTRGRWRYAGRLVAVPAYTVAVTAALHRHRDAVVLSHGDTLAGDVMVMHAVDRASLAEKCREGQYGWLLNPMHAWTLARDQMMIGGLRYRRYVALSRRVAQELKTYYGVPASRIALIPNGIDLDRFNGGTPRREAVRREFGIASNAPLLLFVSHEFGRKGLAYAIRALQHLPAETRLLVVGSDAQQPYEQIAAAAGVGQQIIFAGARRDMPAMYDAADALVLPTNYETFSLVCMEAMASGVPVFATRVGGIEDYLQDGVNGYAIQRDPEEIAIALRRVLDDPAHLARLRAGARATAQGYAWSRVAARYHDLLHEVWRERQADTRLVAAWSGAEA